MFIYSTAKGRPEKVGHAGAGSRREAEGKRSGSGMEAGRKRSSPDGSGTEADGSGTETGRKRNGSGTEAERKRDGWKWGLLWIDPGPVVYFLVLRKRNMQG